MPFTTVFPLKVLKKTFFFSMATHMFGFQRSDPIDHGVFMVFILYTNAFLVLKKFFKSFPIDEFMILYTTRMSFQHAWIFIIITMMIHAILDFITISGYWENDILFPSLQLIHFASHSLFPIDHETFICSILNLLLIPALRRRFI